MVGKHFVPFLFEIQNVEAVYSFLSRVYDFEDKKRLRGLFLEGKHLINSRPKKRSRINTDAKRFFKI